MPAMLARQANAGRAYRTGGSCTMGLRSALKAVWRQFAREHRDVRSFEQEVEAAGIAGRSEGGMKTIPVTKVVGSVGRAQNLRSDFFYKSGKVTSRFLRIGEAMR